MFVPTQNAVEGHEFQISTRWRKFDQCKLRFAFGEFVILNKRGVLFRCNK